MGQVMAGRTLEAGAADEPVKDLGWKQRVLAYVLLTKPRIIELLLITTVPPMFVAAQGVPSGWLIMWTLIGGALSAGGAGAINCYFDRDIDEMMTRTRKRPLPQHKVAPKNAVIFGAILGALSFGLMWFTVNPLSSVLTLLAMLFYVFVYTIGMKRHTPQNIVIGGAAGAMPAMVGWTAVTNQIELPALALFAIVFYWTPPHFWALSLRYEKEYRAAGVPMMPVVYGREETAKHILLYSFMLLAMCLAFFSVGHMGLVYLGATIILNGMFIWHAFRLYKKPQPRIAWGLFRFSIYYLAVLFISMAVDQAVVI